jgi:tetratricopeptide (TPR) repeat protein
MKRNFILILCMIFIYNAFCQDSTSDNAKKVLNGWDLYSAGRYKESIQTLEMERKSFPDRINIYVIMAWDYSKLQDFVNMERISLEGLKYQPTDSRILRNLGEAYYFEKKYFDSAVTFEKFLKYKYTWNDQYMPYAYYYLGVCYYNLKYFRKADIALSTANYFLPKDYNTIILMADVKEILGEFKTSFNYYTLANQIQPNTQRALEGIERTKNK